MIWRGRISPAPSPCGPARADRGDGADRQACGQKKARANWRALKFEEETHVTRVTRLRQESASASVSDDAAHSCSTVSYPGVGFVSTAKTRGPIFWRLCVYVSEAAP